MNLQKGSMLMNAGYYSDAVKEFAGAVMKNPHDPWTHIMLGTALYWSGQVDQAMQEFLETVKIAPDNAQAHQLLGIVYAWKGDVESAFQEFSEAEKYAPERADIQMDLGSIYESMGKSAMALKHFKKAVSLEPEQPLYHFQLGSLYSRLGRDSDAVDSLEKAIRNFNRYEDALLELASVKERMGELNEAVKLYRRAVRLKPMDSVARFRLALALVRRGDSSAAQEVMRDAFRLMPKGKEGGISLSLAYSGKSGESGHDEPARTQSGPASSLLRNLERIPLDQEARVQVELFYMPKEELVMSSPHEGMSLKNALEKSAINKVMGIRREFVIPPSDAKTRMEKIEHVSGELDKALEEIPANSDMHMSMNIQTHKIRSEETKEARERVSYQPRPVGNDMGLWVMGSAWMDIVHEVMPGLLDTAASGVEWMILGLGQVILGEPDDALNSFSRAVSAGLRELGNLGSAVAWIEKGEEEKAMSACEEVLKINPKNKTAKDNLKWLKTPPVTEQQQPKQ